MQRAKFIVGGVLILAAVVYLIASSTQASAEYFMTIDELKAKEQEVVGRNMRVSGAIIGVGAVTNLTGIKWKIAINIVIAWILTIPVSAFLAAGILKLIFPYF